MHYCLRISDKEFEKQRRTESKEALIELLDQILSSKTMSCKEKSKRIKLVSILELNYFIFFIYDAFSTSQIVIVLLKILKGKC